MNNFAKMQERTKASRKALKEFGDASYAKYDSHSYAAGWLESVLVSAMNNMTKKDRDYILNGLREQTEQMQKEVDI